MGLALSEAKWQWSVEDRAGRYVAGCAIMPEIGTRGWFCGYPGEALRDARQILPLIRAFQPIAEARVYTELRAWVRADDPVAIGFAERFGFRYDCGPARGLSMTGLDMNLMLWRA